MTNPHHYKAPSCRSVSFLAVEVQLVLFKASQQAPVETLQRPHHQADFLEATESAIGFYPTIGILTRKVSKHTARILLLKVCPSTKT